MFKNQFKMMMNDVTFLDQGHFLLCLLLLSLRFLLLSATRWLSEELRFKCGVSK